MRAPLHPREAERLQALRETGVLDTEPNSLREAVVQLAADLCGTPIAAISLVDAERQWFPSITGLDAKETHRDLAFCAHTILGDDPMVVNDATNDARFSDNALVTDAPGIRFYAGIPLKTSDNLPIGSLCVIDTKPRQITPRQIESLKTLAGFVTAQLELSSRTNQLHDQQALTKMLVDNATDYAMVTLDTDGLVTSWNTGAEHITGFAASQMIGQHHRIFFLTEHRDQGLPESLLREAAANGSCSCRGWRQRHDGSRYHTIGSISCVRDDKGECTGFVKVTRDDTTDWLTGQKLNTVNLELSQQAAVLHERTAQLDVARRTAEDASKSKSEFLANMSHEIRTPMTAILGYAELLASESYTPDSEALEFVNTIRRNGEHLLSIINDILDISKIEAGQMTVESIDLDPAALVRDVIELMSVKASSKGLSLSAEFDTPVPQRIQSDPVRLRQVLVNLVGNAIKFTESGSVTMVLSCEPNQRLLRFDIVDTGIGLTESQTERIFGAFAQADASTTRKFGGTGLGLQISRRLANMLGGDISVQSEPGVGSCFSVTISVDDESLQTLAAPSQTESIEDHSVELAFIEDDKSPLAGVRVLLAEDGPDNQLLIEFHLRSVGAHVHTVSNGRLAVEALTRDATCNGPLAVPSPFDLIVTDMQMPEMDGYESTRLLRQFGCRLPIIALTANAMSGDLKKCTDAGCDMYVTKPIDRIRLIGACVKALDQRAQGSARAA